MIVKYYVVDTRFNIVTGSYNTYNQAQEYIDNEIYQRKRNGDLYTNNDDYLITTKLIEEDKMNQKEKQKFSNHVNNYINKEITNNPFPISKEIKNVVEVTVKDIIYLLGISINKKYKWASGFESFCKELNIKFE